MWFTEANAGTNNVAKVTAQGTISEYPLPTSMAFPENIVSAAGLLWYVDEQDHLASVTTGGQVTLYSANDPSSSLALGPDGNLWVPEFNGMKVDVYSTAGVLLHSYASGANPSTLQLGLIAAGPARQHVVRYDQRIQRHPHDPNGNGNGF